METRAQMEAWQAQCNRALVNSSADMLVAQRLVAHGLNALDRIAALEAELAQARDYATTLAVSMHRQHYTDAAPNWQPLPDLVGLLTQIDNMYAGLRNDFEAAQVENKRLVGMNLAGIKDELAQARAERDAALADAERWRVCEDLCYGLTENRRDSVGLMLPMPEGAFSSTAAAFRAAIDARKENGNG